MPLFPSVTREYTQIWRKVNTRTLLVMFRTPADMDWTTMVPPGTSQIQTPGMHMASPMVVSTHAYIQLFYPYVWGWAKRSRLCHSLCLCICLSPKNWENGLLIRYWCNFGYECIGYVNVNAKGYIWPWPLTLKTKIG